uniref:Deoxycytidylate deaminase n=1 Tax=Geladintestivirus 6 TaxID=3233138 RepID=A0AAU8MJJ7_9CAUD
MTQEQSDKYYIKVAQLCAKNSYAVKLQVGAIIVKDEQIMSDGFNGTPCGFENKCEVQSTDGCLHTLSYVLHAESNAILKCAKYGRPTNGSTLYITHSPCIECAKLIIQAGIIKVVYLEDYRKTEGLELLKKAGINVKKIEL